MKLQIMWAAFECVPFMKTGGLGDVAGSLPAAIRKASAADVRVFLPKTSLIPQEYADKMKFISSFYVPLSWRWEYCGIFKLRKDGIVYYFLDNERYFFRDRLYGEFDDAERTAFFSKAVLEACLHIEDLAPDLIHVHDWHTALLPVFLREFYMQTKLSKAKTVFTIHNLKFQGIFDGSVIGDICGFYGSAAEEALRWDRACNYMKAGCIYADKITTVSPSYAREICGADHGEGLDWLFERRQQDLSGILNGIDYKIWNPYTDVYLKTDAADGEIYYSTYRKNSPAKKRLNKAALQKELGLAVDKDALLCVIISRLTDQKGLDLLEGCLQFIADSPMQLAVLGVGDERYEQAFGDCARLYPDKIAVRLAFDNELSHKMYAGADLILVPSRFEPCGLTQMIAMRYGTVPLVRQTGGLKDTVNEGNGFTFASCSKEALKDAIVLALKTWQEDKKTWQDKIKTGMDSDFSWTAPAGEYIHLYEELAGR